MRRLLSLLLLGNTAMYAVYLGVGGPLVQTAIANIDPGNKVSNAGLVAGVSAIFATLFNPVGGALSDRTHSRFGRRNPWLIGGSLAAFLALAWLANATSILKILIAWSLAQAMMNLFQAALTAIVPDRIPREKRGTASAVVGVATSIGAVVGTQIAAAYVGKQAGFYLLGGGVVAAALLVVLLSRDPRPGQYEIVPKVKGSNPLRFSDFRWVFIGRALMVLSYFMVFMFQLYILDDYITLPEGLEPAAGVATLPLVNTACACGAILVSGPFAGQLNRYRVFVLVAGIAGGLVLLLPLVSQTWGMMLVFTALQGMAFGVYMAVDTALVTLVLPRAENAARDMGVLNIANAGPQVAGPFAAAGVIAIGGYPALFVAGAVIAIAAALTVIPIRSVK